MAEKGTGESILAKLAREQEEEMRKAGYDPKSAQDQELFSKIKKGSKISVSESPVVQAIKKKGTAELKLPVSSKQPRHNSQLSHEG